MIFVTDERAQSTLIGFILLFGILILAFSSYQAVTVPNQNAEVEFNHNQGVQNDMQELRNSLLDVRSVERVGPGEYEEVSEHRPVRVRLGTQYPSRLIALNPPPISGTLQSIEPESNVRIENAELDTSRTDRSQFQNPEELDNFLNSVECTADESECDFETRFLVYQPNYNEYQNPPDTILEHSRLYNDFSETDLTVREQSVVDTSRDRITIVLFDGDISRSSSQAVTLDPQTLDGPTAPVPIRPKDGGSITLQLPTTSRTLWEEAVDDLADAEINNAESNENRVVIELDGSYELRMAEVGLDSGTQNERSRFTPIQYETGEAPDDQGPTIDSFTTKQRPGENVGIRYSFQASAGDTDLDQAVVELRRDGTFVAEQTYTLSGTQGGKNNNDFEDPDDGQEYTLELTVTDTNGQSVTETRTQQAG